jgi:AcrR family transcriptional regulator
VTRTRLTATERSERLVDAAITAFAAGGYAGTTTDEIARLGQVSQPYVIRLFGTKQRLFIAGFEQAADRIEQAFREADATDLEGLGTAYTELLEQRELLGMLLHGFAACSDEEIGAVVRTRFGRIYTLIRELTGADEREATDFLATGIMLTVLASMRVIGPDTVPTEPWMAGLADSLPKHCG